MNLKRIKDRVDLDLANSLTLLCNNLDNVFHINEGGCIYVAWKIAEKLEEINIPYKVRKWYEPYNTNKEYSLPYHISLVVEGIDINPSTADDITNPIIKDSEESAKMLRQENTKFEDRMSRYWKQSYKPKVREEINKIFNNI